MSPSKIATLQQWFGKVELMHGIKNGLPFPMSNYLYLSGPKFRHIPEELLYENYVPRRLPSYFQGHEGLYDRTLSIHFTQVDGSETFLQLFVVRTQPLWPQVFDFCFVHEITHETCKAELWAQVKDLELENRLIPV
jgi:hypothetical protein